MGRVEQCDCVIPAAGRSERMGRWKPVLPFSGSTIVQTVVASALRAGARVILVTGYRAEELVPLFGADPRVELVHNPRWSDGMFSSVQAGVARVRSRRFFVTLGDKPGQALFDLAHHDHFADQRAQLFGRPAFDVERFGVVVGFGERTQRPAPDRARAWPAAAGLRRSEIVGFGIAFEPRQQLADAERAPRWRIDRDGLVDDTARRRRRSGVRLDPRVIQSGARHRISSSPERIRELRRSSPGRRRSPTVCRDRRAVTAPEY